MAENLPDSPIIADKELRKEEAWNFLVGAMQRGVEPTAQRIFDSYNERDIDLLMQSILFRAMNAPPKIVRAAAELDNAVLVLLGRSPVIDPLLDLPRH